MTRSLTWVGKLRWLLWAESVALIFLALGMGLASLAARQVPAAALPVPTPLPWSSTPGVGADSDPCIVQQAALAPSRDRVCLIIQ